MESSKSRHVWHLYVVRVKERNRFREYLAERNIQTLIHYPIPPTKQEAYKDINNLELPLTHKIHNEVLSLPISPLLSLDEQQYIVDVINDFDGILERNKEIYTLYKSIFLKNYQLEVPNVICRRVSNLSEFAYKSHVVIFRDDFIEDCLHWIGSPILIHHLPTIPNLLKEKILHIISKYCIVGGHISLVQNTIAALKDYEHLINSPRRF